MARTHLLLPTLLPILLLVGAPAFAVPEPDPLAPRAEVGADDFRISFAGDDGNAYYEVQTAAAAWGRANREFLVAWSGRDDTVGGDVIWEIHGQFVAPDGTLSGSDFRISTTGPDGDPVYAALNPDVAYNGTDDEFLVVWFANPAARRPGPRPFDPFFTLHARVVDSAGSEVVSQTTLSSSGPLFVDMQEFIGIGSPEAIYDRTRDKWVIVWSAQNTAGAVADEYEIFLQRFDSLLVPDGPPTRVSNMGPPGDTDFDAFHPAVVHNERSDLYFVVWQGDDGTDGEMEVWGQHVEADTLTLDGGLMQLSDAGPPGDASWDAERPDVAWNPFDNKYLVVFRGDSFYTSGVDDETEIWGQFVDSVAVAMRETDERGAPVADNFRISSMGGFGNNPLRGFADHPAVVYAPRSHDFLVAWHGWDGGGATGAREMEIFGRRVDPAQNLLLGLGQLRLSSMGPALDPSWFAKYPALALVTNRNELLVAWRGADDFPGADFQETEIYGQLFGIPAGAHPGGAGHEIPSSFAPEIAWDGEGGYLEVWEAPDQSGSGIFARYVSAGAGSRSGLDRGLGELVNVYTTGNQSDPDVAWDRQQQRWVVIWEGPGTSGVVGIHGRLIESPARGGDRGGLSLGAEFRISNPSRGNADPTRARIAHSGDVTSGEPTFLVVWQGEGPMVAGNQFKNPGILAPGGTVGLEFQVNDGTSGHSKPAVASDSETETFLIVWEGDLGDANGKDVRARFRGAADTGRGGLSLGAEFQVNHTRNGAQTAPAVAGGKGEFVVAWESDDGDGDGIYGNAFAADPNGTVERGGLSLGAEFRVNSVAGANQSAPDVTKSDDGGFTVAWQSYLTGQESHRNRGKVYDSQGDAVGNEIPLARYDADGEPVAVTSQLRPRIDASGCELAVAWESTTGSAEVQEYQLEAELQMQVFDGPDPVAVGQTVVYLVAVRNGGACPSGQIQVETRVSDLLIAPMTNGCLEEGGGQQGIPICTLPPLEAGATDSFTVSGVVPPGAAVSEVESLYIGRNLDEPPADRLQAWAATAVVLFADGFESGDTSAW